MQKKPENLFEQQVINETKTWIKQIIIAHNFCPFAKNPFNKNTIRYAVSCANSSESLVDDIIYELSHLQKTEITKVETAILIAPRCLADFFEYNQFLDVADAVLEELDLVGIIQIASFHPDYCFADLAVDDARNYTNRSIYPMFHFIREDSVEHARATYPNVDAIADKNMHLLLELGLEDIRKQRHACIVKQ